jgi:predicted phage gp36 major capsid-like protein
MEKGWLSLLLAGIVSLVAFGTPNVADANARNRQRKLDEAARHELKKDRNELERDRRDLSRLYRNGGSRDDVSRKRAEIRGDLSEIAQDRQQLGRYDDYHGDRNRYGNYGRYDNSGWWNRGGNGWWNRGQISDRDRSRWDYRHD